MTFAEVRIDVVILACAVSAGIHGALVPEHFADGTGPGAGFVGATVLLALLAVVLTRRPSQFALVATAALFAGLIVGYALAATTGLPVIHPERETVDALALSTKAVEVIGLVAAVGGLRRPTLSVLLQPKGSLA